MNIIFIGKFTQNYDEGMRNVGKYLKDEFEKNNEVYTLEIDSVFRFSFWKNLRLIKPDVIYTSYGPSINILFLIKLTKILCNKSISIVHATHPSIEKIPSIFVKYFQPDLTLVNSSSHETLFNKLHFKNVKLIPLGVNTTKFKPISLNEKFKLRKKYNLDYNDFIVLHVGHIKYKRNVSFLTNLSKHGVQGIIVGSSSTNADRGLISQLKKSGCIVIDYYIEKIEEVYQIADCYLFPTETNNKLTGNIDADAIEIPLSILEAMACNLPIITTPYGGLTDYFEEKNGFFYLNNITDFPGILSNVKEIGGEVSTRDTIFFDYSWEKITELIEIEIKCIIGDKYVKS